MPLRWLIMVSLMSFMTYRLAQNPGNLSHWGLHFWQMCLLTTAVAMILGVRYRPRSWCAICPVGTVGNATGGGKYQLTIGEDCRSCNLCAKNCPMGHSISEQKEQGYLRERDCLQCSTCVNICPTAVLTLEKVDTYQPAISPDKDNDFRKAA
jgi:polyferredoxin